MTQITMEGKYYRRGDPEKRQVRILCVDRKTPLCVIYLDEMEGVRSVLKNGFTWSTAGDEKKDAFDLLPIEDSPVLVLGQSRGQGTVGDRGEVAVRGFTPGPWKACSASEGRCKCHQVWSVVADKIVATSYVDTDDMALDVPFEQRVENARLIAAAPELLEACLAMVAYVGGSAEFVNSMSLVRSAVAKATGEKP